MGSRTLASLILLVAVGFAGGAKGEVPKVDVAPFVAREIASEVHLLSTPQDYYGPAIGNVSVIEQSDGFVVVDSGLTAGNGRTIVDYIRSRSDKPVKALVITHWHNDHPQGASAIRKAWPNVRIIATEATKKGMLGAALGGTDKPVIGLEPKGEYLANMKALIDARLAALDKSIADPATSDARRAQDRSAREQYAAFLDDYRGTFMISPTETFDGELTIADNSTPVKAMFLGRANTAGDAIVWLPKQRIVITGDVVVAPTPFGFFSFPGDWIETLKRVKGLGYATLIPGHGEPQNDTVYVDRLIGTIEDIRAQVGPLARTRLPLAEVQTKVDYSRYGAIFGTNERRKRLFKAYWTDPMTENAWKEAKGLPIVQGEGEVTVSTQAPKTRN